MIIEKTKMEKWLNSVINYRKRCKLKDETDAVIVSDIMVSNFSKEIHVCGIENIASVMELEIQWEDFDPKYEFPYIWYVMYKGFKFFELRKEKYEK